MSGVLYTAAAGLAGASGWTQLGVALAGVGAGMINAVVGSGTLITFPVLLAAGLPPVTANVSNTLGLVPGSVSGAIGYRRELAGLGPLLRRLGAAGLAGGLTGAVLLLALPAKAFEAAVPVLIAGALVLVLLQPLLAKRLAARAQQRPRPANGGWALLVGVYLCGIYGGYFGAAQGVLLLGLMGVLLELPLQRINGVKNVLALFVNGIAAVFFLVDGPIDWRAALLIAGGSVVGGQLGALVGRRLPAQVLRGVIVAVGLVAIGRVVLG
ncbi:sulfite exporter TauE/SafE family protein [Streptacidiphilus rugosus]|uniref:sulfite exporter TauE/SafE family protein n=1 Tax=Streptacidiphilus rugosus TaxID=405783 RepID=UPI00068FB700|nr:sulfite exporter TauE/SafE family protein [Streptacidiphilus rugosus]